MKNNLKHISDGSSVYLSLKNIYLKNTYIDTELLKTTIYVPNEFVKNGLSESIEKLKEYFQKEDVTIVVAPELFETSSSAKKKKKEGNFKGKLPSGEYIEEPYIVGEANENANKAMETILDDKKKSANILFLHGRTGTGKSHLIEQAMYRAYSKQGKNIYMNDAEKFIDEIKLFLNKRQTPFFDSRDSFDFFVIDDFQLFNRKSLEGFYDILFSNINTLMSQGKKLIFTSDQPLAMLGNFPERIRSRLKSGYNLELELPGSDIKKKYIDAFCAKNKILLEDVMVSLLINTASTIREIKGYLFICQILFEKKELDKYSFAKMAFGKSGDIESLFEKDRTSQLREILREFFGATAERTPKGRKTWQAAKIDSILYHLLHSVTTDITGLRKKLDILPKHHIQYTRNGAKHFKALSKNIQQELLKALEK